MESGLHSSVVCITGASGGIGRAMAEAFAKEGARLALFAHRQGETLRSWVSTRSWAQQALVLEADVRKPRQMEAAFSEISARWGRPSVCVVNAGIWPQEDLLLSLLSEERILHTLDVNLLGAMWSARAFLRALSEFPADEDGRGASLVLIGSTAGRFGEAGHCDYAVSKAGLYGLLRSLKNEIVRIDPFGRVNLIEPGWTDTPMAGDALNDDEAIKGIARTMALRQIARAEDIASAALFLASPLLARHLSGEILTVAGGMEGRLLWAENDIDPDGIRSRLRPRSKA